MAAAAGARASTYWILDRLREREFSAVPVLVARRLARARCQLWLCAQEERALVEALESGRVDRVRDVLAVCARSSSHVGATHWRCAVVDAQRNPKVDVNCRCVTDEHLVVTPLLVRARAA